MRYYLKFGGIKGDVTEPAHRFWIEVERVDYGIQAPRDVHEAGVRPKSDELSAYKHPDSSTPAFHQALATNADPVDAVVDFVRDDGGTKLRLMLSGARGAGFKRLHVKAGTFEDLERLDLIFKGIEVKMEPGTPHR